MWSRLKKKTDHGVVPRDVACACKPYAAPVYAQEPHKGSHLARRGKGYSAIFRDRALHRVSLGRAYKNVAPYVQSFMKSRHEATIFQGWRHGIQISFCKKKKKMKFYTARYIKFILLDWLTDSADGWGVRELNIESTSKTVVKDERDQ